MCEILNIENLKTFEDRYNYDVSKYIEEKKIIGKRKDGTEYSFTLSYLSWAYAQKIAKIFDPNFKWFPVKTETGSLVHDGMVLIEMTFLGVTEQHYYPILDAGNKAIKMPNAFDVNTAQMRGMTKLFSMMSGFGLKLYTGEDIKGIDLTGQNTQDKKKDYTNMTDKEKIDICTKFINANRNEHEEIIENMTNGKTLGEMAVKELEAIVETIKITKKKGA